jgi:hypothetical protein
MPCGMNTHTNYQTSFRVLDPDKQSLHEIQKILFKWVRTKEKDAALRESRAKFYSRGEWRRLENSRASIETDKFLDDGLKAWALFYTHRDKELGDRRFWYTDVGLKQLDGEVVVFVKISYGWNVHDLRHEQDHPAPSVPYFVRTILAQLKSFSGSSEFRIIDKPLPLRAAGQGRSLRALLMRPGRRYPVVVVHGTTPPLWREANRLATDLTGTAQVISIEEESAAAREIQSVLPHELSIRPGFIRIFFPFGTRHINPFRHRWYDPSSESYKQESAGIVNGLLRNHGLNEIGAVRSIKDVRDLVARAKLLKQLKKDGKRNEPEIDKLVMLLEQAEQERDELKQTADESRQLADYCAAEAQASQEKASKLTYENQTLKQRLEDAGRSQSPDLSHMCTSLPSSLIETVALAEKLYGKLSFSENAKRSAAEYSDCECYHEAWQIFHGLHHDLHALKFGDMACANLERAFIEATGYELSMTESGSTNRDARLSRLRQLSHDGADYDISPHVKHGNRPPKILRVHFAFDEEKKRIVIGYVGEHMDTAGTKRGRGR